MSHTELLQELYGADLERRDEEVFVENAARAVRESVQEPGAASSAPTSASASPGCSGTDTRQSQAVDAPPPPWKEQKDRSAFFLVHQSWQGVVTDDLGAEIAVRLFDDRAPGAPELTTTLPKSEIDAEDLILAVPGGVFYWRIGYFQTASGRRRTSLIRFRRLPAWSARVLQSAREEASRLYAKFGLQE
jgi:hypothetical protein